MVSSKESFTTLNILGGTTIHMGDDSSIPAIGIGSIKIQHGEFKNVLYVPPLTTNLLSAYQMNHTGPPNQVVFGPDSVEIIEISTGKNIVKGIVDHSYKEYVFSDYMAYLDPVQTQLLFELDKGIKTPLLPIAYTYLFSNIFRFRRRGIPS